MKKSTIADLNIEGAYEHNLKHINLSLPKNKFIVVTGPSGSGKSSLVFDTIFQESQRLFLESLSLYSKSYIRLQAPAKVKQLSNLCPSISVDQKTRILSRRSTVGTVSEISDILRLLYARFGNLQDQDGSETITYTKENLKRALHEFKDATTFWVGVPLVENRRGTFNALFQKLLTQGYLYVWVDGKQKTLSPDLTLSRHHRHSIIVLIDKLKTTRLITTQKYSELEVQARKLEASELVCISGEEQRRLTLLKSSESSSRGGTRFEPHHFSFNNPFGQCKACQGLGEDKKGSVCELCEGSRINEKYGAVQYLNLSFKQASLMTLSQMQIAFEKMITKTKKIHPIESHMISGFKQKLTTLNELGLGYLPLSRSASTLSGGETQRLRIGSLINLGASGYLYVLDEPSIGLHPINTDRLLNQLKTLAQNNTVVVVEHDLDTIQAAEFLVELGPGGGQHGGEVIFTGDAQKFFKSKTIKRSTLHEFLNKNNRGESTDVVESSQGSSNISLKNIQFRNLKISRLNIPLHQFVGIAGVSGSGKSSLLFDVFIPEAKTQGHAVYEVTQSPVGKSSRSTVATYLEIYNDIRKIFAASLSSRMRGLTQREFSFNASSFRCETCKGLGYERFELSFLPQSDLVCERCHGMRFQEFVLRVRYKDKNIAHILDMTLEEASLFFHDFSRVAKPLKLCLELGLGYLKLGQLTSTLSGGEAQRIKLIYEISKRNAQGHIYCLDEPTTGLSMTDIQYLLKLFSRLMMQGNSVLVIEHHPVIIGKAHHIIELGPGGGPDGGQVIAEGSPPHVRKEPKSLMGKYL
jgi:excinuclease ABC subunit A